MIARAMLSLLLLCAMPASAAEPDGGWLGAIATDHPLAGRIWSPARQSFVGTDAVRAALAASRFVLLGETHDNPDHHRLQAWAVEALVAAGRRPAVVWEMLSADQAPALAAYLARPDADAAGIGPAVGWAQSGWPDWALYRPIAAVALPARLPMAAGNVGGELKRAVLRDGLAALPDVRRDELALVGWRQSLEDDLLDELEGGHCGLMPRDRLAPLVAIQRLRDATMADALLRAGADDGAVLVAGAGHVRRDRGVPWYLAARGHGEKSAVLVFREVRDGEADPATYDAAADIVWFTPRFDDRDHCAELRAHMRQRKGG